MSGKTFGPYDPHDPFRRGEAFAPRGSRGLHAVRGTGGAPEAQQAREAREARGVRKRLGPGGVSGPGTRATGPRGEVRGLYLARRRIPARAARRIRRAGGRPPERARTSLSEARRAGGVGEAGSRGAAAASDAAGRGAGSARGGDLGVTSTTVMSTAGTPTAVTSALVIWGRALGHRDTDSRAADRDGGRRRGDRWRGPGPLRPRSWWLRRREWRRSRDRGGLGGEDELRRLLHVPRRRPAACAGRPGTAAARGAGPPPASPARRRGRCRRAAARRHRDPRHGPCRHPQDGSEDRPANAASSQQTQGSTGGAHGEGTEQAGPQPTGKDGRTAGENKPGGKGKAAEGTGAGQGGGAGAPAPDETMDVTSPVCGREQLGQGTGSAGPADSEGRVYGAFRVVNTSATACSVEGGGTVGLIAQGSTNADRIHVVDHTSGDAATGLPDPATTPDQLVLKPGQAYEVKFAWIPDGGGGPTGCVNPGPSPTPEPSEVRGGSPETARRPTGDGGQAGGDDGTGDGGSATRRRRAQPYAGGRLSPRRPTPRSRRRAPGRSTAPRRWRRSSDRAARSVSTDGGRSPGGAARGGGGAAPPCGPRTVVGCTGSC